MKWSEHFSSRAAHRLADPDWSLGASLPKPVIASLQRFQVGESGGGTTLIAHADAAGDPEYARAIRLFVAEENEHARLLSELLRAANSPTLSTHWSDVAFVGARRAIGLRCELLVLTTAELIALTYYGALARSTDSLLAEVARRILDDETHHIAFQRHRLRAGFAATPPLLRRVIGTAWRGFAAIVAVVVAADHSGALRAVGCSRRSFMARTNADFAAFAGDVFGPVSARTNVSCAQSDSLIENTR